MPVDTTKVVSSRRTQRKLTEEELQDIEQKRLKGELSCAECRRLKLRCDKKVPCGSCFRRGCESICPLGVLTAGQGTRFILADTDQLHEKIYQMSNRIRQLEDALAILQSSISDQRHPLLSEDLLRIKFGSEAIGGKKDHSDGVNGKKSKSATGSNGTGGGSGTGGSSSMASGSGFGKTKKGQRNVVAVELSGRRAAAAATARSSPSAEQDTNGDRLFGQASGMGDEVEEEDEGSEEDVKGLDGLGTLTLGNFGEMQYFGRSAGSETLLMKADGYADDVSDPHNQVAIPPAKRIQIERIANLFPFCSKGRPNQAELELLEDFLPSTERASQLCDYYIRHGSYFFRPIKRDELVGVLAPGIYEGAKKRREGNKTPNHSRREEEEEEEEAASPPSSTSSEPNPPIDSTTPHRLAVLFFTFALGALLDIKKKPYNSEAERYYDLGRAALSLRPVYDSPSMDTVRAMGLMATYHSLAGKKYSRDSAWCIMSSAAKLAQSLGLHRESARWNIDLDQAEKRRALFWEVFSADVSHSLALGRPPAIHLSYVDCEFPKDEDPSLGLGGKGEVPISSWRLKYTFARSIYSSVASLTLTAKPPSYSTILDLDKKVREVTFPSSFNPYGRREDVGDAVFFDSELCVRDFYASQHRAVTMLYLHRSFFAQAMLEHPTNPLLSPYAPSFLTAYRNASIVIKATKHMFERCAPIGMRLWFLMCHTFSAAVIAGTVVTRSPKSSISLLAMKDFELAMGLFEKTAEQSQRAKVALDVLLKLREKAKVMYAVIEQMERDKKAKASGTKFIFEHPSGVVPPEDSSSVPIADENGGPQDIDTLAFELSDDIEDDLAIFGGHTRILEKPSGQMNVSSGSNASTGSTPTSSHRRRTRSLSGSTSLMDGSISSQSSSVAGKAGSISPTAQPKSLRTLEKGKERVPITASIAAPQDIAMDDGTQTALDAQLTAQWNNGFAMSPPPQFPHHMQHQHHHLPPPPIMPSPAPPLAGPVPPPTIPPLQHIVAQDNYSDVLPSVHPTLLQYLNQESVKRVQFVPGAALAPSLSPFWGSPFYAYGQFASDNGFWGGHASGAVEMGLSGEGGIDQSWMNFMRDCGIMDTEENQN